MQAKGQPMSAPLINQIVAATVRQAGPLPDEKAHRRYLASLSTPALEARLAALGEPSKNEKTAAVEFWGPSRSTQVPATALLIS